MNLAPCQNKEPVATLSLTRRGYRLYNIEQNERSNKMTIGEDRVRINFNPGGNMIVNVIKQQTADLISLCETLKSKDPRLATLAQTAYEEAAMWAVKAATTLETK